jgi:hypothetical protein
MIEIKVRETKLVGVNERGNRVGEDHQSAKLSDEEVELIRELANPSDGAAPMAQRLIAEKFEISRGTVSDIVTFRRRASYPVGFRRVKITVGGRDIIHKLMAGKPAALQSVERCVPQHDPADND